MDKVGKEKTDTENYQPQDYVAGKNRELGEY
jgi:hypothetical protein